MPGEKQQTGVSRRTLVKSAALGSLALAAGGVSLPFGMRTAAAAVQQAMRDEEDKIVWGACSVNCGSRCALRLHVKIMKSGGLKLITLATMSTAIIRFAPVCGAVQSVGALTIRIALTIP